jgi:FtsP/CotA-like multicopper oxidase with cupredoxin domain
MQPIPLVALPAALAAALVAGGVTLSARAPATPWARALPEDSIATFGAGLPTAFREPPSVSSRGGVLQVTLAAARSSITVGGQRALAEVYNGSYAPPTLRVRPGDLIRLRLINRLDEPTNFHTHGLHVSPAGNADNVFLTVQPGQTQEFEFRIAPNHPPGLFWYHPHAHHFSNEQVRNGMSGALIVEGLLDPFPALQGLKERVLLLKDIQLDHGRIADRGIGVGTMRTVNGLVNPTLALRPGETELWRIGNVGANLYYRLRLDGHRFYQVARDGNRLARLVPTDELFIPPGGRIEVIVQGGSRGVRSLRTLAMNTGPSGNQYPAAVLATMRVEGEAVTPRTLPTRLLPVEDLRSKVTGHRTVVFSEGETPDGGDVFFIDGKTFDPDRVDTRVRLGAVEEWTIRNDSDELHDFHIHQGSFQLVEVDGTPQPLDGYYDTVNLPVRGEIKIIIPFTDPVMVGKFVYHCHLLSHEDKGMMATIEVVR